MTARYETRCMTPEDEARCSDAARAVLEEVGAVLPDDFHCTGTPQVRLSDMTCETQDDFDLDVFKGRLVLGGSMNSSDVAPMPCGPVRISLIRWGTEPDQCGKITVGRTDLNGTAIVSWIGVTIGDNVSLAPRVIIMDTSGHPSDRRLPDVIENKTMAEVVIEDNARIGYGATIMSGVTIGHDAVVGPGAVVMWNVPAHAHVVGNPAKQSKIYRKYMTPAPAEEA
jgi:acetyltransferase-like isoleucine patch superfamily enzyme